MMLANENLREYEKDIILEKCWVKTNLNAD